jgi:hypothetical protein
VLRLNVEDPEVARKRGCTRSKGGDTDWLFVGSAIAVVSGVARCLRAFRRQSRSRVQSATRERSALRVAVAQRLGVHDADAPEDRERPVANRIVHAIDS